MAAEKPFKQQGTIPFTWEIRPGVAKDQPEEEEEEQQQQRHGSSDNSAIISDEEECKKKSYSRFRSDQPQKKPRTRTRSFMDIYNLLKPRVSPFVGEKDKVKARPETMSPSGSVKKSSSSKKRSSSPFSSGRWSSSSSLGNDVAKWSAFGYH